VHERNSKIREGGEKEEGREGERGKKRDRGMLISISHMECSNS
jgi:hypothetical protein